MENKHKIGFRAEEPASFFASDFHKSDEALNDKKTEELLVSEVTIEMDDPYALPEVKDLGVAWNDMSSAEKTKKVVLTTLKLCVLLGLLYMFICSLDILSSAFRLLGGKAAGEALGSTVIAQNPVAGLMVGLLATVLVQSSSTSTSIVVSMVGSEILTVRAAIPIIMGTNIGTTVTNTIVSMGQAKERNEFRRAFAGATVHDIFNWLTVLIMLPVEAATGYLYYLTDAIVLAIPHGDGKSKEPEFLKTITKPFTDKIIQLDSGAITSIAKGENATDNLIKNGDHIFNNTTLSNIIVGVILLLVALFVLCACLIGIVKLLHSMLQGKVAVVIRKVVNAEFKNCLNVFTGYIVMMVGMGFTILLQSSSIFTSAMTPLVGIGVITLERMYPLTLGSNIGTTFTSTLAAFASTSNFYESLQIAFCHLFFNISGIILWYTIPPMRKIPIKFAKGLGNTTAKYRWFAMLYLLVMFFLLPAVVFGLSVAGFDVLLAVGVPVLILLVVVVIINIIQSKRPSLLPMFLQSWSFLPEPLRSLEPYDRVIKKCKCCKEDIILSEESSSKLSSTDSSKNLNNKTEGHFYNNVFSVEIQSKCYQEEDEHATQFVFENKCHEKGLCESSANSTRL
ncbi:hypothetical protein ACJMK2_010168 [Sinanodonta woodiana]|uniref:Uncharacterized protein n=1 Tax=Sinanodonta woodiana TaxID=1069815 RepID=A0ABD3VFS7_SINWO